MISSGRNLASLTIVSRLEDHSRGLGQAMERLTSGMRINRASDDAASLAIAEALSIDARVYGQAARNVNDAISLLSITQSALTELQSIVTRQTELAIQASNGGLSASQRQVLNLEANALVDEFNRIIETTEFNSITPLRSSNFRLAVQAGYGSTGVLTVTVGQQIARIVGAETFSQRASYATSATPYDVHAFDLNGDGVLDLMSSESNGNRVSVQLGNGDGTFKAALALVTGTTPHNLEVADFNGDGRLDIANSNFNSNSVSIFIGNGDGAFKAGVLYGAGANPRYIQSLDVNDDGATDLVVSSQGTTAYQVLLNNGNGTFLAPVSYGGLTSIISNLVGTGDFNGDGREDVVVHGAAGLELLVSMGDGTFNHLVGLAPLAGAYRGAIGDINSDGHLDVVSTSSSTTVYVTLGNGNGTFRSPRTLAALSNFSHAAISDYNGDGAADIVSVSSSGAALFWGDNSGAFSAAVTVGSVSSDVQDVIAADFNRDGAMDIAMADGSTSASISIMLGNGLAINSQARLNLMSRTSALGELEVLTSTRERVNSEMRSLGAYESRLNIASTALFSSRENFVAAESRIRDADIAQEGAALIRLTILRQASSAALAQANAVPEIALQLLKINGGSR